MRRLAWGLAGLLAVLLMLVASAAWLATTSGGVRWLAATAARLSDDRLKLEGIEGHLGMPLGIRRLSIATATQRIEIEGLRLEWQPRALWQRRIEIDLLAARMLRVNILKKDPTPPTLPASLRLPLDLRARAIDLAALEIVDAGQTLAFRKLHARLDGTGARYRLSGIKLETPWAQVGGQVELGKDAPFALRGQIDAARRDPVPVRARLDLTGQLAAPRFEVQAAAANMRFLARGEAAPFARVRLPRLLVAGEGIDPRQFLADAPAADLAFSGVFEGQPGERLLGSFSLSNRLAGTLDQQRLALANLTGAVLGDSVHADFSALLIDLGAAGQFSGAGQWRNGRFALDLESPRLDLAGLHRDLHATAFRTVLKLAGDAARQTLDAEVAEAWGSGTLTVSHADSALHLEAAHFRGQTGQLAATGTLQLDASRAFAAKIDASGINPARIGRFPRGRLNARGEVSGALRPELRLQTRFTLPPGELEGRPVRGQGRLRYENRHLADADLDLDLAGNRAKLKGAYGRAGDRVDWDVDAPALARLGLGLSGSLSSRGSVSGDPARPQIAGVLAASGLRLPGDIEADALALRLDLQAAATGAFDGRLDARGIAVAGRRLSVVSAAAQGRRDAHTLTLDARMADWRMAASLAGGLDARQVWRGQLRQAEVQGRWPVKLAAPADLLLSRTQQQVGNLALHVAGGRVTVAQFSREGTRLASRGTLASLPLAPVLEVLDSAPPVATDLRIDGDWNLRLGDRLDGQVRLRRQSGDVRLVDPALDLGLTTLALDLDAEAGGVAARVEAISRDAGRFSAEGRATLQREGATIVLPRTAPLAWTAQLDVPDLRLAKAFIPVGIRADARLAARLAGSGSLAAPRIDGQIEASRIRFAMPEQGIAISDGTLELVLAGDRVRVQQGELKGPAGIQGGGGRIVVSGEGQLTHPQAGITLNFEKFAAIHRGDRRVTVSGATRLGLDGNRVQLAGELRADRARLEIPEASRPMLSSDVVVVGQPPRSEPASQRFPLALDLRFDLGDDFLFKGGGLDARLGGALRVFTVSQAARPDRAQDAPPGGRETRAGEAVQALRGEGTIRVEAGRFAAYGQALDIERGQLLFAGPLDNPGLDVLAVRKTPTVKAGVQVGGTVQRPLVKLYSDPAMPDSEKLSWLVLGHGPEHGSQQELALLQLTAGALLGKAESVRTQAQLADSRLIDSFGVRAGEDEDLANTVVSVGKRVSSRVTLSYEQTLQGLDQMVKILYQLSPHVRLEAGAGDQSSFDVFYTRDYD